MCELKAYYRDEYGEELVMDDVALVQPTDGGLLLTDIMGIQKQVDASISEIRLMEHKLFLKR